MGDVKEQMTTRRRSWHALSDQEKQQRLAELRRRQEAQIALELRFLRRG